MADLSKIVEDLSSLTVLEAAELSKLLEEKWVKGLEMWFPEGIDTEGICLIKVAAHRIQFWGKNGDGEYRTE